MVEIEEVNANFEREPLIRPFGFKGGYLTEIWQAVAYLRSSEGKEGLGLCSQSVLWSDAEVFAAHSESGGNALMYAITDRALQMVEGERFDSPINLQEEIWQELYEYAKSITSHPDLRETFVLNALVSLDNALWMLLARESGILNFEELVPETYKPALSRRQEKVASIPMIGYTTPIEEVEQVVEEGYFILKIKLGQPGTQEEMLEKDKERLTAIHEAVAGKQTSQTEQGRILYYLDANGRYESKETVMRMLDHARDIGAYEQIQVLEEPFPEHVEIEVHDIPARLVADESAHTENDVIERIEMGYEAIALKPVAKTMSMTMKMAQAAYEREAACFCADLTVNPILVEWNKIVAALVGPFPGLGMGMLENNGRQNYSNWDELKSRHPHRDAGWTEAKDGVFRLNSDFYERSGGMFESSGHYLDLVNPV